MLRQRHYLPLFVLFFGLSILLTGCCGTCTSLSGRYSEAAMPMGVAISDGVIDVSNPIHVHGKFKQSMEERGRKSGCGEFFWSSWYNDGPEETLYSHSSSVEEVESMSVIQPTPRTSSKAAHRIINSRPSARIASIELDSEI